MSKNETCGQILLTVLKELDVEFDYIDGINDFYVVVDNRKHLILSFDFGLNEGYVPSLIKDKSRTALYLGLEGIPRVSHEYFGDSKSLARLHFTCENGPVIIKDNFGRNNQHMHLVDSNTELDNVLTEFENKEIKGCVSEFVNSNYEYSVNVLNGEIVFGYKKERNDSWKHSLEYNSPVSSLTVDEAKSLNVIVDDLYNKIGVRYANIDFLLGNDGYKVLRIDSKCSFEKLLEVDNSYLNYVKKSYRNALLSLVKEIYTVPI